MKFNGIRNVLIWSEDYRALSKWYQDKLELAVIEEINHPDDTGIGLDVGLDGNIIQLIGGK